MIRQRSVGASVALAGLAFILTMTLRPQPGVVSAAPSLCIVCGGSPTQDILLNILLFLPFGIGMRLLGIARWKSIGIALLLSATIELLQIRVIPGRDSSLGDVLTNTTGAAVGVLLADTWRLWVFPGRRAARRLFFCGAAAWLALLAFTAWGTHTALPRTTYWGQWTPDLLDMDRFPGELLHASVGSFGFPRGMAGDSRAFRERLLSDTMLVRATVIPGGVTRRLAPIVSVFDVNRTEVFLLGQHRRDALFSLRMNATAAGLAQPAIRLPYALPAPAASARDTVHLTAGVVNRVLLLRAEYGGAVRETRMPLSPGIGWSYLIPFHYAFGPEAPLLSMLWLGCLTFVVGYWSARTRGRPAPALLALTIALGLAAIPVLLGCHSATWWEWFAAIAGGAGGWKLGFRRQDSGFRENLCVRDLEPGAVP